MPLEVVKPVEQAPDKILTKIRFNATPMAVRSALEFARASWTGAGVEASICNTGELVLAEVLNNVVEHAHPDRPQGQIELDTRLGNGNVICAVRDDGVEMPCSRLQDGGMQNFGDDLRNLPERGFGRFMIHQLTEDLSYMRQDGWNRLEFRISNGG